MNSLKFMFYKRSISLSLMAALISTSALVYATTPALAQETQPGDACTAPETGFFRRSRDDNPGPAITGQNFMFCDGTNWLGFIQYDDPTDSVLFRAPAAVPADATFGNSQWSLWLDEASDDFELKGKKSDGTVINATVGGGGGSGLWTDNTTYISFNSAHMIESGQTLPAVLDDNGTRMFFYPDKAAFRGGTISGANDAWQNANIGTGSFAWGLNAQASGTQSIAMGRNNTASNPGSVALGKDNTSSGYYSFSVGMSNTANNYYTIAMGYANTASGNNSVAIGDGATASGDNSIAMGGYYMQARGNNSIAIGSSYAYASGNNSIVLGREAIAGDGTAGSGYGDHSMAIGLGNATGSFPRVTGDSSLGIFMGNQGNVDVTASNVMSLMGGSLGIGTVSPDTILHAEADDASNSAVTNVARLTHTSSGAPAAGIGAGLQFEVETAAANNEIGVSIEAVTTDVTAASEDFALILKTMAAGAAAAERVRISSTGEVGIGQTATAGIELDVLGDIEYTGTIADVSDRRMKTEIENLPEGQLDKLLKLEGVSFKMKGHLEGPTEYGFIAQDVQPIYGSLVYEQSEGMLSLNYIGLIAPMVEAMKEQTALIKKQATLIEQLEARLKTLEDAQPP